MQQRKVTKPKISKESEELLNQMFNSVRPKARYMSELHIQQYTDSIYKQIINGDIQVSKEPINIDDNPAKSGIEENLRKKLMIKVQREKSQLENRLGQITNSINSMKKYNQLKAAIKSPNSMRVSFSGQTSPREDSWKKQIKKRQEQINKKKKIIEEAKKKKNEEYKEQLKKAEEQKNEKKKKQILEHMKAIENRMKQRDNQIKEGNQRYARVKNQKSMYQKLAESYEQQQRSLLQQRKQKLAEIRNFHQPINQEQIRDHQIKFLQLKKQKEQIRDRQRKMNQSRQSTYKPFYESVFYKKIVQDEKQEPENPMVRKAEKIKQFSEHVKQHFVPSINERKRQEIQDLINEEEQKVQKQTQRQQQLLKKSKIKGMQYLQILRNRPKRKDGKEHSRIIEAPKTERITYQNYLTHHSEDNSASHCAIQKRHWTRILQKNEDKQSKALKIHYESQRLEQQLKRKQKQTRLLKQGSSSEIDQEYYDMIKAKLDLLEDN